VFTGAGGPTVAVCLTLEEGAPDIAAVDALARLLLAARRLRGTLQMGEMCPELAELLDLVGLRGEFEREAEQGKVVLGVEEGMDPGDPIP
jgi:hypothetical protein